MKNMKMVKRGWKIAMIILSVITVAAVTTLSVILFNVYGENTTLGNNLENMYQRAYYELIANINEMEISFSKLMVTTSNGTRIQLLNDIAMDSQISASALSTLSAENLSVIHLTRYVNQTGDFCSYLMKEVVKGNKITDEQQEILDSLYQMTQEVGAEVAKINDEIAKGGYIFTERLKLENDIFTTVMSGLEESIVKYPSLIYDGPFSAALLDKDPKGLTGEDITPEQGVEIINEKFADLSISEVTYSGENNSYFPIYNYEGKAGGDTVSIELSKKGGQIAMADIDRTVEEPEYSPEECAVLAEQYLEEMGYENMESVWVSNSNSIIYVNLAPVINEIVYYPDLIKLKIASSDGSLIGIEALSYIYNHTERNLPSASISEAEAAAALSTGIAIDTVRLALIPLDDGSEALSYEFSGIYGGAQYYIYIDAATAEELNIMRVIDSDQGTLLM